MRIQYCNSFDSGSAGIHTGKLAVIEYWDDADEIRKKQHLEGFGRMNFMNSLEKARSLMKTEGVDIKKELLSIPILIVELN
jgi:hypothetical protein